MDTRTVNFCDFCNKNGDTCLTIKTTDDHTKQIYDLCEECTITFRRFRESRKESSQNTNQEK